MEVLRENGDAKGFLKSIGPVSILVLMEVLREIDVAVAMLRDKRCCFNPCSNGSTTRDMSQRTVCSHNLQFQSLF